MDIGLDEPVRVGVVGAGNIVGLHHLPILSNIDQVTVSFIADIDTKSAASLSDSFGGKVVDLNKTSQLPGCDVGLVATPVGVRDEYIRGFGEASVPVFSEKPYAINTETHETYLDQLDESTCNYMRRYYSSIQQIRTICENRLFGNLQSVSVAEPAKLRSTGRGKGTYQTNVEMSGGGILVETGCHTLSQITHVLPDWNVSVVDTEFKWNGDIDIEVSAEYRLEKDTKTVPMDIYLSMVRSMDPQMSFEFEHAVVTFDHTDPSASLSVNPSERVGPIEEFRLKSEHKAASKPRNAMFLAWRDFLQTITNQDTPSWSSREQTGLEVTKLTARTYQNATRKRPI